MDIRRFPKESKLGDFGPFDGFYLLSWGRDLRRYFPFLTLDADSHPYELFYQIWKLSYLFGKRYSDLSVSFEQILDKPRESIRDILKAMSFEDSDYRDLHLLVEPVQTGRWTKYAGHDWFSAIETRVENVMESFIQRRLPYAAPGPVHAVSQSPKPGLDAAAIPKRKIRTNQR